MGRTEFLTCNDYERALVGMAEPSTRAKWRALRSARLSTLKKYLTGTTLSEMGIYRQPPLSRRYLAASRKPNDGHNLWSTLSFAWFPFHRLLACAFIEHCRVGWRDLVLRCPC